MESKVNKLLIEINDVLNEYNADCDCNEYSNLGCDICNLRNKINQLENEFIKKMNEELNIFYSYYEKLPFKTFNEGNYKFWKEYLVQKHNQCSKDCENKRNFMFESHRQFKDILPNIDKYYEPPTKKES